MASNVVVVDQAARRHMIKTVPSTPLSDVLQEACTKIGLDASQYGLKHGEKAVDLSRNIRMSGLTAGAKLTLVQASKSPSVVSIALQIPPTSESSGSLGRLTDKIPSNTSLWQVLRRFESGALGGSSTSHGSFNFTQRATPMTSGQTGSGAGRLCYEMPVLNVMGRELATFPDLQKTLAQIGLNSGSALIRLSFRTTGRPLEEAMAEISQYFVDLEAPTRLETPPLKSKLSPNGPETSIRSPKTSSNESFQVQSEGVEGPKHNATAATDKADVQPSLPSSTVVSNSPLSSAQSKELSFFNPPSSNTPAAVAATAKHNESDYIPTITHAQQHQARLQKESQNRRLKSDKELEEEAIQRAAALAEIKSVLVRVRYPDQSQAQRAFDASTTVADLYAMCREVMDLSTDRTSIQLRGLTPKGAGTVELKDGKERLVADLGWRNRVLVTVSWGNAVSSEARKRPSLKEQFRQRAEDLKVEMPPELEQSEVAEAPAADSGTAKGKEKKKLSAEERESRLRKLMGKVGGRR